MMTKQRRSLDRDKIMNAAQAMIREGTTQSLTFPHLAAQLGIRSQSLYNYFNNLDDLTAALGTQFMTVLYGQLTERLTGVAGVAALRAYVETAHDYFEQQGSLGELIYYVHNYPDDNPFVVATGKVLDLLHRLVAGVKLRHMAPDAFVQGLISTVLGYTVIELMGFLPAASRHTNFEQMLTLYLNEVYPKGVVPND